ncbi:DUF3343 domain-containing protein [Anaerosalibacter sp. Marseille-P3206]|uniref:DUF3343 domain-containing protein n=1 Tax=Anaerosalibacter sp. Marseille-P3206 TaxID=1871005 RepID=UPI0009874C0C|nr:DUF3343 domain-containing protein [Anaerosalibacter sp. Marseille-P3206]
MKDEVYGVLTFESTHHAISGEKVFKEAGLKFKTIPTPREITSSCGLSIRFDLEDLEDAKKSIEKTNLAIKGIYKLTKVDGKYSVELMN